MAPWRDRRGVRARRLVVALETISAIVDSNHWLRDTSPVLHIAPVPAAAPDWTAAIWLVGLGVVAATAGLAAFGRRDLVGA